MNICTQLMYDATLIATTKSLRTGSAIESLSSNYLTTIDERTQYSVKTQLLQKKR